MSRSSLFKASGVALAIAAISSGANAAELEEVIVTAQKRAESLQDVPVSLMAISGTKIAEAGLHSFQELSQYVPNLTITENAVNTIISMRGIGVGANQSFEQSVGVYVDGVHYGKSRQSRTALYDVQQVEVLRGPQGILFGKNTLAGAINVVTATPDTDEEFGGKISVSKESFDGTTIEGHLTGSIGDTIGLRLAYKDRSNDGSFESTLIPGKTFAGEALPGASQKVMPTVDESMWRASVTWEPTDSTRVELKHAQSDHVRLGQNSIPTIFEKVTHAGAATGLMFGTMNVIYPGFEALVNAGNQNPYRDGKAIGGCALETSMGMSSAICAADGERPEGTDTTTSDTSLSFEMALDNGYTLSAVAGKGGYEFQDGLDADWLPLEFVGRSDIQEYDHTSQEFRITSPTDGRFSWVGGVYLDQQEQEIDRTVVIDGTFGIPGTMKFILPSGQDTFLALSKKQIAMSQGAPELPKAFYDTPGSPVYVSDDIWNQEGSTKFQQAGRVSNWTQDTNSEAIFFQGTYNLTDSVALTAGARYTEEDKRSHAVMALTTNVSALNPGGLTTPNTGAALAGVVKALSLGVAHEFDERRSSNQFLPAANIEWTQSEDSMFYLSYSEGFKSGGFNSVDDQLPEVNAQGVPLPTVPGPGFEYDDENAESIELGGKHTLLDGSMTLNWALYDSTYKNQQVSTFVGTGFVVTNAASTEIRGLEVDLQWQATDHLKLGVSAAFNDGKFGSYAGAGCNVYQQSGLLGLARASGRVDVDLVPTEDLIKSDPVTSFDGCQATFGGDDVQSGASQDRTGDKVGVDYNGSLTADYVRPVMGGLLWMTSLDVNFTDGVQLMGGSDDQRTYMKAFSKTSFRTGLKGENWAVMLYGKNVFDKITPTGAFNVPLASGAFAEYTSPGSVWGATVNYNF